MRLATFNIESLDLPPRAHVPLETRMAVLRPALERLAADVLCLQEVNAQHVPGRAERAFAALDQLLAGTRYATYHRAATTWPDKRGPADVHNLVTLSSSPFVAVREILHDLVPPLGYTLQTAEPKAAEASPIRCDRPMLMTTLDAGQGRALTIVNLHLRAPLAAAVPGQKLAPFVWKSVAGWAEGYFLSGVRRTAQALELRLLVDRLLDDDPDRLILVA